MPCDYKKYPANWKSEIRPRILARAGNKCEICQVENCAEGYRFPSGRFVTIDEYARCWLDPQDEAACEKVLSKDPIRIVLTIAHIHDPDPLNCADDNLKALCQRCHNKLDAPMRAKHAAETRLRNKETKPNLFTTIK